MERSSWTVDDRSAHIDDWSKILKAAKARPFGVLKDSDYLTNMQRTVLNAIGRHVVVVSVQAIEQDFETVIKLVVNVSKFGN